LKNIAVDLAPDLSGKELDEHEAEMEEFMQEIDADKELRANINLFKKAPKKVSTAVVGMAASTSTRRRTGAKKGVLATAKRSGAMASTSIEVDDDDYGEDNNDREDNNFDELDEEEVRLEELLDDLELSDDMVAAAGMTSANRTTEEEQASMVVLTAEEAARIPAMQIDAAAAAAAGPFDTASQVAPKDYKFI
jgi:hypothetical protein